MKFINEKTSKRVCDHMNKDHIDSVHKYLKFYAKIGEFKDAKMLEINNFNINSFTNFIKRF